MAADYWKNRELQARERFLDKSIATINKRLALSYAKSKREIMAQMVELYDELLIQQAAGQEILVSDLYRYNRYYELVNNLNENLAQLESSEEKIMRRDFTTFYKETSDMIGKQFGANDAFSARYLPENTKRVIEQVWCADGKTWSDRLWTNKELMKENLLQGLVDVVAGQKSGDQLKRILIDRFDQAYSNADRLVRTEMSHIYNSAAIDRYSAAGLKKYRYLTAQSEVCDDCKELNLKVFNLSDAITGENMPPMHPNCRCTVIPVTELDEMD